MQDKPLLTTNISNNLDSVQSYSHSIIPPVTSQPPTIDINNEKITSKPTEDIDSGWPDFKEAILKKVKKPARKSDSIFQNGLYGNDWFDTSWSALLEEEKDEESLPQNLNVKSSAVSFVKLNITKKLGDDMPKSLKKTTHSGKNVFKSPTREDVPSHSEDYKEDLSNRMPKPVFMYHRVTTSPQERKSNNAIIAVSVARRDTDVPSSPPSNKQFTQRTKVMFHFLILSIHFKFYSI